MKMEYCHNVTLVWCIMIHSLQQSIDEYLSSPFLRNYMYTHEIPNLWKLSVYITVEAVFAELIRNNFVVLKTEHLWPNVRLL